MEPEFEVVYTIGLKSPYKGNAVIQAFEHAVEKLGGELVKIPALRDDKAVYTLGRSSEDSNQDYILSADGSTKIDPERMYTLLEVSYHPWPGMKFAVMNYLEGIQVAGRDLRDALKRVFEMWEVSENI